jgi:hypothetical protein
MVDRREYYRTYYNKDKASILDKKKQQYNEHYEQVKNLPEYKQRKQLYYTTYIERIKKDPDKLKHLQQQKREYYLQRKEAHTSVF